MSHTRSFKKEKKQTQVRSTSYKKNNKIKTQTPPQKQQDKKI
jgi:hypothetical protein